MKRRDKINYYLDLAEIVAQRGTCLRRQYGAVIVKNDEVISTGYVGAPRGRKNTTQTDRGIFIIAESFPEHASPEKAFPAGQSSPPTSSAPADFPSVKPGQPMQPPSSNLPFRSEKFPEAFRLMSCPVTSPPATESES